MSTTTANDAATTPADNGPRRPAIGGKIGGWFDDRTGLAGPVRHLLHKVFPDHWSFMLGEVAMYSMVACLITGAFLTMWFVPSMNEVTYEGSYAPLNGLHVSAAFDSTMHISFEVAGGLLIRQIHHWGALFFVAAVGLHAARVFFTGAFRKPREINWVIGTVMLLLAMIEGFAGYSLPDDLLSGTGLRVMQGFLLSSPVIGSYMSYFLFGGSFPGTMIIPRLFTVHALLIPAILIALLAAHLILLVVQKHTQYPGPGRTNDNVVGYPVMPVYAAKAGGFFFIVFGVITLVSALVAINPVWMYGPYDPSPVTAGVQPDWYMWFSDGALRLLPGWLEFEILGFTLSLNVALGSIVLLPVVFIIMGAYPFLEAWVTGDKREHHLLDRPRNQPVRTAIGAGALTAYLCLALATTNDIIAIKTGLAINDITVFLRIFFFVGPVLVFFAVKRLCLALQLQDREKVLHGHESGVIQQTADGRFYEVHEPLSEYERWALAGHEVQRPLELVTGQDGNGVDAPTAGNDKRRAAWSRFFFSDRVEPPTPAEVEAAHHHGHDDNNDSHALTGRH
ncbi:cytochrome b [Dermatophilus congolensis]|uniref:cytochrome bc1 complex cytochrome b subunit n=1 Tax=Dermatophilus congolensis TaxID=1863 RepID=UPI001AAE98AE|nr:cytochrome bc complex cytochrome b subunit [Dermatophilus congolensis]MBO3143035.1 cytochrome bc complex cytochrome b subunit [Dermatophilus congolensis]MBO3152023.1 cytochrome bc complex cytochrome b subunit [Dermatophilus congolensis]MBO3160967.1 cytochrome bc complex cytochrome b subunit [Dermatophilus congolensis]MBO3163308.1 cytochrome bc complex cytochrome b subunit [Dermatophilus congolensis]MBO3176865.1 cytochrome bc complex cytochrome b subunit [Dermatophilus congolensis]